ncbi:GDSL-type esterase/lipase family protein [Paracoccus ravus]|uniref:GDSL-type esterase/lipase family protein n=1 Tax=Paracoccus ravus TaxID=2447760 RepID=UPI00106E1A3A|nr:GDSL-type esterase/lipase family protein [Paracoccus ravus]
MKITAAAGASLPRVPAFGDGLTAGYGLAPEKRLVPRLAAWVTRQGQPVHLVNDGVAGETTAQGRARIASRLAQHPPDGGIVELGRNDLRAGVSPARERPIWMRFWRWPARLGVRCCWSESRPRA